MMFTDKEIELARDMKEAGLKWKPGIGDWFTSAHPDATPIFLCTKVDSPWLIHTQGENHIDTSIWLPLWHQCRKILVENDIIIVFSTILQSKVQIDCFKCIEGDFRTRSFIGTIVGDTDLELFYKVILLWVLDAPRVADDVETGDGV